MGATFFRVLSHPLCCSAWTSVKEGCCHLVDNTKNYILKKWAETTFQSESLNCLRLQVTGPGDDPEGLLYRRKKVVLRKVE